MRLRLTTASIGLWMFASTSTSTSNKQIQTVGNPNNIPRAAMDIGLFNLFDAMPASQPASHPAILAIVNLHPARFNCRSKGLDWIGRPTYQTGFD